MSRLARRRVFIVVIACAFVGALAWAGVHGVNLRQRKQARLKEMNVRLRARMDRITAARRRGISISEASDRDEMSAEEFWRLRVEAERLREDLRRSVWQKFLDAFRSEQR
jgi:hypothetical protein